MPIKPENKRRYPADWQAIRAAILERAGNCCERCGVANYAVGFRNPATGVWIDTPGVLVGCGVIRIVLTVAHLDHCPEHNDPGNLAALCQRCHNRHDAAHRAENRRRRRAEGAATP